MSHRPREALGEGTGECEKIFNQRRKKPPFYPAKRRKDRRAHFARVRTGWFTKGTCEKGDVSREVALYCSETKTSGEIPEGSRNRGKDQKNWGGGSHLWGRGHAGEVGQEGVVGKKKKKEEKRRGSSNC